jgi:hypothetical protein
VVAHIADFVTAVAVVLQLMAAAEILPQLISDKDVAAGLVFPSLEVRQLLTLVT